MKKSTFSRLVLSCVLLHSSAVGFAQRYDFQNPSLSIGRRVENLISLMSLEEKVNQLRYDSPAIERLGVPEYNWWNECLHGVARNGRATVFPQAIGMAATWDTDLMQRIGDAIGTEARAKYNVSVANGYRGIYQGLTFWSPNVNIFRDPRWGRGQETYGEDPFLTARIGTAFVKGLQGDDPKYLKAAGMAKHFAVHNGPEKLRHEFDAVVSKKDLWETYLPAFEALVKDANVEGIMGAYNRVNGEPACAHPYLMEEVLRKQWGFKGYFTSDCWAIRDFYEGHNIVETASEAAALALNKGCNLNCGDTYPELLKAIEQGFTSEKEIDDSLRELLPTRFKLGLFDPVGSTPFDDIGPEVIRSEAHVALTKEAATKSFVLLKNQNNTLPIDKKVSGVFVTGPTATHAQALLANYYGLSEDLKTFLEGVVGKVSSQTSVLYRQGALLDRPNNNPMDWFSGEAERMEVTIAFMGISQLIEGEEGESILSNHLGDRKEIGLPQNQIDFLKKIRSKANKLVVVLTAGSALAVPEVYEMADALLYAWYPGEQGGTAMADVLFGDAVPSGKLPLTFVKGVEDLPPFEDYALEGRTYRYMKKEPLFPFGFGLSYTTFKYGAIQLDRTKVKRGQSLEATVEIQNTGDYSAEEVVQLYLSDREASVPVPLSSLKSFQRILLAPGESRTVGFIISPEMMQLVDNDGKRVLEKGTFEVHIGGTSPSIRNAALGAAPMAKTTFELR
ncbi:glycoside hydrolase family 3 protein [Flavobacteriaceae bacterium TP-CH-4]|uniref:Glycoside hydrolase family 3 protein n=1 Tax=Pelagihabitans pacificus TaxID=2696054 RepID=A0A967ARF7_9FLAO|nr:glycoside hydrolase family 3 N-terminal domain-containing protein [Pelagihabitans pacificus]NHF58928.1 glycoside hydrolase family 3 protein [Pelagihabitans pacificus]